MSNPLRLAATDAEDLAIVSSCLQDAAVPIGEMSYLAGEGVFAFVCSRFAWEGASDGLAAGVPYERINCAVSFHNVAGVKRRGFDPRRRDSVLALLAIRAGDGYIDLIFSGSADIRLEASGIACRMDDLDHRWPTRWRPNHDRG